MIFQDRSEAGQRLAVALREMASDEPVVLGLPRGGVPVAQVVAAELNAPLDVIIVRKLGVPFQPELAFGAVGEDGVVVFNEDIVRLSGLEPARIDQIVRRENAEVRRRAGVFRQGRGPLPLTDRTALIVDDGIATGATARAACQVARAHGARRVVVAAPVGAPDAVATLRMDADDVVCLQAPSYFEAVGLYYRDFAQVSDEAVAAILAG